MTFIMFMTEAVSLCDRVVVMSKRPGKIKNIYNIHHPLDLLPSERRNSDEFYQQYRIIWGDIEHVK